MKCTFYPALVFIGTFFPAGASAAVVFTDFTFKAGPDAQAHSYLSFAWQGRANGSEAIAMGRFTEAAYSNSIALGYGAWTSAQFGIAIGASYDAVSHGNPYTDPTGFRETATHAGFGSVAIGSVAAAGGDSIALGYFSFSDGGSTAIGYGSYAVVNSLAFSNYGGTSATNNSIALDATAENSSFAALGGAARNGSIAIGDGTLANQGNVALGRLNRDMRRDGTAIGTTTSPLDPLFEVGNPVFRSETSTFWDDGNLITETIEYWERQNAFALYRDNVARFEGPVQIKSGNGYVTLAPAGATQTLGDSALLTLPATTGELLSSASSIDATKLTGPVPSANLTQLVKIDAQGYAVADGAAGGVLRVLPAGDIPMFAP